jgi:Flp pilus assembly protein TadD
MSNQSNQLVTEAAEAARAEQFDKAANVAREALELDPRNSDAFSVLGVALARLGRLDEATEAFQRAVQQGPYVARNYYNLAMHFYGMGNKKDALSMCQEAVRCDGKHRAALELIRKLESETHVEVAPYTTSLGDQRGAAYRYKEDSKPDEPPPF